MKKVYLFALLSIGVGSIFADAPDLTKIEKAVQEGDLPAVKRHWRKINRDHEVDEKREALETLLDVAGESTDDSKETTGGGHNYKKLVPGGILYVLGTVGCIGSIYWQYVPGIDPNDRSKFLALIGTSIVASIAGQLLVKSGWNSEAPSGGRSKAAVIESFFDNALEELEEEDE